LAQAGRMATLPGPALLPVFGLAPCPEEVAAMAEAYAMLMAPPLFVGGVLELEESPATPAFPLPSAAGLSSGGGELTGEELTERMRALHSVETKLQLKGRAGGWPRGEAPFAPALVRIPWGWRPDEEMQAAHNLHLKKVSERQQETAKARAATEKVFVGGLKASTTADELALHFGAYGPVARADILFDAATGKSRGFGFVQFYGKVPPVVLEMEHRIDGRQCGARKYDEGSTKPYPRKKRPQYNAGVYTTAARDTATAKSSAGGN